MKKGPVTPKGFRDINPDLAKKRREAINTIADILEEFDFVPLETPTIEFAETLTGKYGEEEKLIYKFTDRGERELALRYDLTVPLARYIANNLEVISRQPFRRYQIGNVYRGENTQKGRYREFTQFDFDTVGSSEISEDAKVIAAAIKSSRKLGLSSAKMLINDRRNFEGIPVEAIRIIDKLDKIGLEEVSKQLEGKYIDIITDKNRKELLKPLFEELTNKYKLEEGKDFEFSPSLARGLDYYTSTVFELKPTGSATEQSIGGGGRYDNLIGIFAERLIPAVGYSFGVDRLTELL
jgi:histidyl-tRNA synthetase